MTWTDAELQQLDGIRNRKAAARSFRAVMLGLAIVAALRLGWAYGIALAALGMLIAHALEPEIPESLERRAREIDATRAR